MEDGRGQEGIVLATDSRELRVYRGAFEGASRLVRLTRGFPAEECFAPTDQVRRSSRAVCANIAEAWRKRRYQASFVSKLSDADPEAAGTQVWRDVALACGYLAPSEHDALLDRYRHISAQLTRMMDHPAPWCAAYQRPNRAS